MLPKVKTSVQKLDEYKSFVNKKQFEEIKSLAKEFRGFKVNMVNSTPRGGGVAEILKSLIPLMKGVGLKAEWYTIPGREDFFKITKEMHNALQGKQYDFSFSHRKRYLYHMIRSAALMQDMRPDIWVIHDPQPAGVIQFLPNFHPSICRLHIDLSSPNQDVWNFVAGYLEAYDRVVVSAPEFVRPEIQNDATVFAPAIDPLKTKNQTLKLINARHILESFGINTEKPLISQVSRFDPWKDPLGVIKAYRLAKKALPGLQLAMVGFFLAQDDPEGIKVFNIVKKESEKDPDIFLFSDPNILGGLRVDEFVNAVQAVSDVILQRSIKEGFGLTVAEAMWKGKTVIGGTADGIKTQIKNGRNGFIAGTNQETAKRIVKLVRSPKTRERIGKQAHLTVKNNFLMPRLLKDYLKLFKELKLARQNKPSGAENITSILNCY